MHTNRQAGTGVESTDHSATSYMYTVLHVYIHRSTNDDACPCTFEFRLFSCSLCCFVGDDDQRDVRNVQCAEISNIEETT